MIELGNDFIFDSIVRKGKWQIVYVKDDLGLKASVILAAEVSMIKKSVISS